MDLSLKTIFSDCFEFKKSGKTHPYKNICSKDKKKDYKKFKKEFFNNFAVSDYKENLGKKNVYGLLTGYYEPTIKGFSYPKEGAYPIYKYPADEGLKLDPNVSRKKINEGYFKNNNLEIAWAKSEIEAFFLQIQGSGRIELENEKVIRVRYAGSNNKTYTSIGKILIEYGYLDKKDIDMYKIKNWLYKNKELARKFMNMNQRYIFFEEYSGNIKGSSGIRLVPNISVAADKRFIKKGEAIIIQRKNNKEDVFIAVVHDEGAAIKGHSRIDLFTGFGYEAEKKAARLNKVILTRKLVPKKMN